MPKAISRPLQRYPTAFAACATQASPLPPLIDHSIAIAYGKCIGAKYTEVAPGMCEKEFQTFKACVAQHVRSSLQMLSRARTSHDHTMIVG
ncbi:BQ2448_8043 [Microbotryum intermedium]|uniref:BQ2448_8043 protein n=1 Tax=Microbotryum intermedium TaxID=269621 RepID=A0A238FT32_9BASI|nr:BQ2448_8043 [Microbotryum intermedium]